MKLGFVAASFTLLCFVSADSRAEDPTPATCRVSPIISCPAGDLHIDVTVRKERIPLPAIVTLDMSSCSGLKLADKLTDDAQITVDGFRLVKTCTADGRAQFAFHAGGACSCSRLMVIADGVMIAERIAVASPDQNGDLVVDQSDLDLMRAKIGSRDATADLDGDGRVTRSDVLLARLHLGHRAEVATPPKVTTWGEIRSDYK